MSICQNYRQKNENTKPRECSWLGAERGGKDEKRVQVLFIKPDGKSMGVCFYHYFLYFKYMIKTIDLKGQFRFGSCLSKVFSVSLAAEM